MGQMDYLSGVNWKNRNPFRFLEHQMRTYDDCSCVVVGQVAPSCAFLNVHGDFDDSNPPKTFKHAKLKFSLVKPDMIAFPCFHEDFDTAISNLQHIAHGLPDSIIDDTFLSLQNDGSTMINFSWDLFKDMSH